MHSPHSHTKTQAQNPQKSPWEKRGQQTAHPNQRVRGAGPKLRYAPSKTSRHPQVLRAGLPQYHFVVLNICLFEHLPHFLETVALVEGHGP